MKNKLYIAYGSNLNLEQMGYRCPTATVVGRSEIKDHTLVFRGNSYGVATIEPKKGCTVPVLIWNIKKFDEMSLDRYEGYPRLYEKENMQVELDGKTVNAMAYVMTEGHRLQLPSKSYLETIREGYKTAEFDLKILYQAVQNTKELIEQQYPSEGLQFIGW